MLDRKPKTNGQFFSLMEMCPCGIYTHRLFWAHTNKTKFHTYYAVEFQRVPLFDTLHEPVVL